MNDFHQNSPAELERLRRWRLVLGGGGADGIGISLDGRDQGMDNVLEALYAGDVTGTAPGGRQGSLGKSSPNVARWLGDIREYFPSSVVRVMQQDALDRLNLRQMLLEPEMLQAVEPSVELAATLVSLSDVMSNKTKETARVVVRRIVDTLEAKLANPMRQAVMGSLNRSVRNHHPKQNEIDWKRTITANLKNYQPEYHTVIPEKLIGFGRRRSALRDIILCIDQSGSMASSVVYASVFGAVLASLRAVQTRMIVFDTEVADLTEQLNDPVELLFGVQLGGGTDINRALTYCQSILPQPQETILILISDLYEGGNRQEMFKRVAAIQTAGVQFISLLALDDRGRPSFDASVAAYFAGLGIPAFACTPDLFPDLMAAAINRHDIGQWAAQQELVTAR
ncbi:MAG: VWA domain-containing protein [Caldilineaceae bacterium]